MIEDDEHCGALLWREWRYPALGKPRMRTKFPVIDRFGKLVVLVAPKQHKSSSSTPHLDMFDIELLT